MPLWAQCFNVQMFNGRCSSGALRALPGPPLATSSWPSWPSGRRCTLRRSRFGALTAGGFFCPMKPSREVSRATSSRVGMAMWGKSTLRWGPVGLFETFWLQTGAASGLGLIALSGWSVDLFHCIELVVMRDSDSEMWSGSSRLDLLWFSCQRSALYCQHLDDSRWRGFFVGLFRWCEVVRETRMKKPKLLHEAS